MASPLPYYYAPDGKYVLFLDLLGFTSFVRSSFQKKAEPTDDREKEYELALKHFRNAQTEVDREYRRFHELLEGLLRRPIRRGKSPTMSVVFSDCAYVVFERAPDAERFAIRAMRSFTRNDMPVRMGLAYGSFTHYEFKTGTLPNGHMVFAAPFMGTAVVDSYRAESSGIKGLRILVHPSFFLSAPDMDGFLVPLPKSEQQPEAVGELNWYDLGLRLTLRRHIRAMKRKAPAEAQIHYQKTLCFIRRMEQFRSWYSSCCRMHRVANVVYPQRKENMRYWRNLKRTKRHKELSPAMAEMARAEAEANPNGPFRDVLVRFPTNPKEPPILTFSEPRARVRPEPQRQQV
jgi:hypothetical protein